MGVFNKLGQAFGTARGINIEEYMSSVEMEDVDLLHEPADMYIKPVSIVSEDDVQAIEEEIAKKNIILLDLNELNKRPTTRANVLAELKRYVEKVRIRKIAVTEAGWVTKVFPMISREEDFRHCLHQNTIIRVMGKLSLR